MNANVSSNPNTGPVTRDAEVTGAIQPGLTLLGFRDASRLAFRDRHSADKQQPAKPTFKPGRGDGIFPRFLSYSSIAMLGLGR